MRRIALIIALTLLAGCEDRMAEERAAAMTGGDPRKGKLAISMRGCSSCHTIPGIRDADSLVGPPLTSIANRTYIGGAAVNTPQNMIRWLQDPPAIDPKTAMPNLHLAEPEARDIASYLYTLR